MNHLALTFDKPAEAWNEALPLGKWNHWGNVLWKIPK